MPIHGEYHHLMQHKELAEYMGMSPQNIFVLDIGQVIELDSKTCKKNGTVPAGKVLVDGYGVGDVSNVVLRDRRHLALDGLMVAIITIDSDERVIASGPDLISRGFVYVKENEDLMEEMREKVRIIVEDALEAGATDWKQLKSEVKDGLSKFIFAKTKRKPMIIPVISEI